MRRVLKNIFASLGYEFIRSTPSYQKSDENLIFNRGLKLNIGSGGFRKDGWVNVDYCFDHYKKIQQKGFINHDLLSNRPIPVSNKSCSLVYTSHTIEHVTDESVRRLFGEVRRVLIDGGCFRITCPNIDLAKSAYLNRDKSFFYWLPTSFRLENMFLDCFATSLLDDAVSIKSLETLSDHPDLDFANILDSIVSTNDFDYKHPEYHLSWWNPKKLERFLLGAGFSKVNISAFGQSEVSELRNTRFFDSTHPKLSLYVEAF